MSFANFLPRQKKSSKATVAGPLADSEQNGMKQSLSKFKSSKQLKQNNAKKHSADLARPKLEQRFSQSETALARLPLNRSASEEGPVAPNSQPDILADQQDRNVLRLSSYLLDDDCLNLSALALEMPEFGPSFGMEEVLNDPGKDASQQPLQGSQLPTQQSQQPSKESQQPPRESLQPTSTSSTPDTWDRHSSYYSPASSTSSLSDFSTGNTPVDKPAAQLQKAFTVANPARKPTFDQSTPPQHPTQRRTNSSSDLKNKPLPKVPSPPRITVPKEPLARAPNHIVHLMSRYSPREVDESPVDKFFKPRLSADDDKKTISPANYDDLESELDRIIGESRQEQSMPSPRPPVEVEDVDVVAPLRVSIGGRKSTSSPEPPKAQSQRGRSSTAGSFSLFPPTNNNNNNNNNININIIKTTAPSSPPRPPPTHTRLESNSSAESDVSSLPTMEPSSQCPVSSTKGVGRKLRYSLRLPRRQKTTQARRQREDPADGASVLVTLEDDQAALAKSTDRYIDAQIAKALDVAIEEQAELEDSGSDGEDNKKPAPTNNGETDEWSTIYPLKAVKKLGIPLMSSSHIPRLTSSDNEKALRLQLPKLNTAASNALVQSQIIPQPPRAAASVKNYPETPDDVGLHTRSFIMDSPPAQSPIDEEGEEEVAGAPKEDAMPHSDKIFISLNRMETVTEEVPLALARPSQSRNLHPQRQSMLYELDGNGSTPIVASPGPFENVNLPMPSRMPEKVVMALMMNVSNLDQLFNYALLNKQFYWVFKRSELSLIKNALFQMSPPAWELREMSPPWTEELQSIQDPDATVPEYTPTSYLRHYGRDMINLAKLKSLILARCGTFVRPETVGGLAGSDELRADEIDEAFWRIWTFCRIFGCGKNREADVKGQMDWLNGGVVANGNKAGATVFMPEPSFSMNNVLFDPPAGFGIGNGSGLTHGQLYDMMEIWNCLSVLVQVMHGESKEARKAGVFEGMDISLGDIPKEDSMLEEWTSYILTLGPSALVALSSVCPNDSAQATFAKAKQMGVTKWEPPEPGSSRQPFLREAIARTYETRIAPQQTTPPQQQQQQQTSNGGSPVRRSNPPPTSEPRTSYSMSHNAREPGRRPDLAIMNEDNSVSQFYNNDNNYVPPYTPSNQESFPVSHGPPPRYSALSTFIDPVDKAIAMMVNDLGFSEHDAKWALKITDTGDMLDIEAAIRLLTKERKKRTKGKVSQLWRTGSNNNSGDESGPENLVDPLVNAPKHSSGAGWRWA
ncbi:uncharacterized protein TRUGW13939_04248 [Talaromyces rugulosus]|uniref:UBA domain-containing protein n=1 Tax=Talaromyces rugulosus TaxID=121627 RepID=A0A7H8QT36_TALRU|nr:uncharacterized protein TRUGW13939_04248 [Talaromyces rugulosus]QKX57140.1 hypothetical protein TRUGW13939_04248 [Talaromyces rugulosus]